MEPDPAYGVFDTLLVRAGRAVDLAGHVARLCRSIDEVYGVPVDAAGLSARIHAKARGLDLARLRTTYDPASRECSVSASAIDGPALEPRSLIPLVVPGGLGPHKWVDRRQVADTGGADDVLLLDEASLLLECGTANVFVVRGGRVLTPPTDGRILPGTVRARVLAHLADQGGPALERAPTLSELAGADEVFTTSSIREVQPVVAVASVGTWPVGPMTVRLRGEIAQEMAW